jgi:23S rRNA pseudouridine2604 synthase
MSNDNSISLNKFISSTGICSRREADKWIDDGRVKINGTIGQKGNRVEGNDEVTIDGKLLQSKPKLVYIALNKPPGITCTTDLQDKTNIVDFVHHKARIFPIGRLDKPSTGLILLTNDGDIVNKILRAENNHEKEYIVTVDKSLTKTVLRKMQRGVPILDTITKKCKIKQLDETTFKIVLTQGLNRQIRRMCDYFDYQVLTLNRVRIMNIHLKDLPVGEWRDLTKSELAALQENL